MKKYTGREVAIELLKNPELEFVEEGTGEVVSASESDSGSVDLWYEKGDWVVKMHWTRFENEKNSH